MHFATKTTFETQEPKKSGQWLAKPLRHVGIYATWSLPSCACSNVQMATSADWKVTTIDPKESTHPCLNCKEIGFGRPVKSKRACSSVHSNHAAILKFDTRSILHCWGGHHWKHELGILQLSRAILSRCRLPSIYPVADVAFRPALFQTHWTFGTTSDVPWYFSLHFSFLQKTGLCLLQCCCMEPFGQDLIGQVQAHPSSYRPSAWSFQDCQTILQT